MTLPDLKQLNKLITLCRKRGVTFIKIDGIELSLSESPIREATAPRASQSKKKITVKEFIDQALPADSPSPEELLFWSAGGVPELAQKSE